MLIDVHGYIGTYGVLSATPEQLGTYCHAASIDRVFFANVDAAETGRNVDEPTANIVSLGAARENRKLAPLYIIRPSRYDSNMHAIAGALDTEPFAGIFFSPTMSGVGCDDPRLDRYLTLAARMNSALFVAVSRHDGMRPDHVLHLVRKRPRLHVVVCPGDAISWLESVDIARANANRENARVSVASSHATAPQIATAIEQLGGDRVLFGGNGAFDSAAPVNGAITLLEDLSSRISAEDRERFTHRNAMDLIRVRQTVRA